MKAIILEDEHILNANIKEFLELKGMVVESYTDGAKLLEECSIEADIAILDIEVPGANGYEVIEWIKRVNEDIPVIFMTAYTDIQSIEKGYNLGCSDYLKKPFDLVELFLRIQHLVESSTNEKVKLDIDTFFDVEQKQLYYKNKIIKLTKIQRAILKVLIQYKNNVVTYEMLMRDVWDDNYIKINTIASHVKEIRKYLPEGIIESIRAEGYRLNINFS